MAKKVSDVVMGMLSDAGSATRVPAPLAVAQVDPPAPPRFDPAPQPVPAVAAAVAAPAAPAAATTAAPLASPAASPASATAPPGARVEDDSKAPRTLRLRPEAAMRLRASWLEAKRDDVLLTAQDFASDLVLEALVSRRRRRNQTPA